MAFSPSNEIRIDLSGQSAIVTGASQGLGRSIALRLGENGAHVACVARNPEKLTETVGMITAAGGSALAIACDVKDRNSVEAVVDQVSDRWERVDILVNNAGITRDTLLPRMSDEEWDEVIETNLRGAFLFTRAASRLMMRARYGRIINMASVSGIMGNPGQTNYSASKAGLIGLTRSLSRELASRKVTINAIAPGFIASEMTEALGDAVLQEVEKRVPARRLGKAEEVADAVLYLSSVSAGYITGQVLVIDGGLTG